ncbi:MAG: S49 family peptidase [Deltaproteobacteria bacterium]|nr:S49 family peptidase [Deltaproteobacteria bacterium]
MDWRQGRAAGAALLACVVLAWSPDSIAGPADNAPASVRLPWSFGPEVGGVEATAGHAAGLGFLDGWEMGFGFSLRLDGAGLGDGILAGGAGRLGPVGLGIAVSRIGDDGLDGGTTRLDLSTGFRFARWGSIGLRWQRLFGDAGLGLDGYNSVSVSTTLRPSRWMALALGVDQANHPRLGGVSADPILRAELGLRPRGDRVTFGVDGSATFGDDTGWHAGASLRIMPVPGLVVGGYGRFVHDTIEPERLEWGVFLGLSQGRGEVASSFDARSRVSDDDVPARADLAVLFTQGSRVRPSLVTPGRKVVRVSIGGSLPERPVVGLLGGGPPTLGHWVVALDAMTRDDDVSALLIELGSAPDWAQCWELRRAIAALRAAGKRVIVHTAGLDMRGMYLASAADRIWLHPVGLLDLRGLSVTRTYLVGLLDKLGIQAQFVKWDEYKAAPERLTRPGPSEADEEQAQAMLAAFESHWHTAVQEGRGIERPAMDALLSDGPQTMTMAHELHLVDRIVADTELEQALQEELAGPVRLTDGYDPPPDAWPSWGNPQVIAIVPVVGGIVDGDGTDLDLPFFGITTGDRDVEKALDAAVADRDVAAIVLRVSSGGGSVLASDRMYARLQDAAAHKPLIVSFGGVAASGGYYVALAGHEVLSTPLSITGSIGIFTGKLDLSALFATLGITTWTQRTAPHADANGLHRPWTEDEMATARERLRAYYERFVGLVAQSRHLPLETARDRARGRVYVGERALALGLVDTEGGLWDAIGRARTRAGIRSGDAWTIRYPSTGGLGARLRRLTRLPFGLASTASAAPSFDLSVLPEPLRDWLATLASLARGGVQARLPYTVDVR